MAYDTFRSKLEMIRIVLKDGRETHVSKSICERSQSEPSKIVIPDGRKVKIEGKEVTRYGPTIEIGNTNPVLLAFGYVYGTPEAAQESAEDLLFKMREIR